MIVDGERIRLLKTNSLFKGISETILKPYLKPKYFFEVKEGEIIYTAGDGTTELFLIVEGALLSSVLVPFIKLEPPYTELIELVDAIHDIWAEEGKNRERVGEFIQRVGLGNFLEAIGVEPVPEMVAHPRENPYVFYEEYFEEDDEEESEEESWFLISNNKQSF